MTCTRIPALSLLSFLIACGPETDSSPAASSPVSAEPELAEPELADPGLSAPPSHPASSGTVLAGLGDSPVGTEQGTAQGAAPSLSCATPAFAGAEGHMYTVRLDLSADPDTGVYQIRAENGLAHVEQQELLGIEPVVVAHPSADVSQNGDMLTLAFGHTTVWLFPAADEPPGFYTGALNSIAGATEGAGEAAPPCPEIAITCWSDDVQAEFAYDSASGSCLSAAGEEGLNPWSIEYIRETGDGECAQLSWQSIDEGDHSQPTLAGWDLRGAQLDSSSLQSARLIDAQLEGARLSGMILESAEITGSVDAHTLLPEESCTLEPEASLRCQQ